MASTDPWVLRWGVLWSAELGDLSVWPVVRTTVRAEFDPVTPGAAGPLLDAIRQVDPISPTAIVKRFEIGCECFSLSDAGSIAAYGWLTRGPEWVGEFERELHVAPGEAYIWDCATMPGYRRRHLFGVLLCHIADRLRGEGLRRLWIIGATAPRSLLRGVAAAGFEPVMSLTYFRLLDKRSLLTSPLTGSPGRLADAHRLLRAPGEHAIGPLIFGNSSRPKPPDTHFDR